MSNLTSHFRRIEKKAWFLAKGAFSCFVKFLGLSWIPPEIEYQAKIPCILLESEIDALIAGCEKTTSLLLLILKETGMRIGEAM